jgi:hypothetical protein
LLNNKLLRKPALGGKVALNAGAGYSLVYVG